MKVRTSKAAAIMQQIAAANERLRLALLADRRRLATQTRAASAHALARRTWQRRPNDRTAAALRLAERRDTVADECAAQARKNLDAARAWLDRLLIRLTNTKGS